MIRNSLQIRSTGTKGLGDTGQEKASSAEGLVIPKAGSAYENTAALLSVNHGGWQMAGGQGGERHLQIVIRQMVQIRG